MTYNGADLAGYLFGLRQTWDVEGTGQMLSQQDVDDHRWGQKVIPSAWFSQSDVENVSVVLYSNMLTVSKFLRMSHLGGDRVEGLRHVRMGTCCDPTSGSAAPLEYRYDLDDERAPRETWGQGLVVILNPNARVPLAEDFFPDAVVMKLKDGVPLAKVSGGFWPTGP